MASPLQFAKKLLFAMSDETFLSSLDSINFRTKHVEISHGYWLAIAKFVKNNYTLSDQPKYLSLVKSLFVERLVVVSATKIKKFFLGTIKRSFIDFKNLMYYIHHFLEKGNIVRKDLDKLRQTRYFEYKARQHYLWYLSTLEENQFNQQDVQPSDFDNINRERLAVFPVADTQYNIEDYNNTSLQDLNNQQNSIQDVVFPFVESSDTFARNIVDTTIDQLNQREFERLTDNVNQPAPPQQPFELDLFTATEEDLRQYQDMLDEQDMRFIELAEHGLHQLNTFTPIQRIGPSEIAEERPTSFPLQRNDHFGASGQVIRYSNGNVRFRRDLDDVTEDMGSMSYEDFIDRYGTGFHTF